MQVEERKRYTAYWTRGRGGGRFGEYIRKRNVFWSNGMYSGAKDENYVKKIGGKKVCDNPESALIYDVTNLNIFERKKYDLAAVWVQRQVAGGFLMR